MSRIEIRPMPPASLERVVIDGPAGAIEIDLNDPKSARRSVALIAHPNPVQGGTKDNKVVTTLAKAFYSLGYITARPNFRGVGASSGAHDAGIGETEDLVLVAAWLKARYAESGALASTNAAAPLPPEVRLHVPPLVLAGFSFGSFVQTRVAKRVDADRLVLVGPAVNRFPTERVPSDTLVIHGEHDDVVPLQAVLDWARPQQLPIVVVPGGEHFFHGRLSLLAELVVRYCS